VSLTSAWLEIDRSDSRGLRLRPEVILRGLVERLASANPKGEAAAAPSAARAEALFREPDSSTCQRLWPLQGRLSPVALHWTLQAIEATEPHARVLPGFFYCNSHARGGHRVSIAGDTTRESGERAQAGRFSLGPGCRTSTGVGLSEEHSKTIATGWINAGGWRTTSNGWRLRHGVSPAQHGHPAPRCTKKTGSNTAAPKNRPLIELAARGWPKPFWRLKALKQPPFVPGFAGQSGFSTHSPRSKRSPLPLIEVNGLLNPWRRPDWPARIRCTGKFGIASAHCD